MKRDHICVSACVG